MNMTLDRLKVAFLGPRASFSHQAAAESFGRTSADLLPHITFADAFAALQQQEVDYAIIPCENSTNGSVVQTFDLLADRNDLYKDVKVCGEHYLTVHQCLLVRKGSYPSGWEGYDGSITKLYTHPQAWGQCELVWRRQDVSSTSKGAEIVSKEMEERSAAIASRFAAEFHGVDVLKENIEDRADNTTRFLILKNVRAERTAQLELDQSATVTTHKTLISFAIDHSLPGALADALLIFKAHGLNLTSINTRPSLKRAWQYIFFVECGRTPSDENKDAVLKALNDLRAVTDFCRDLGTWQDQLGVRL
ncbi:uncharacterized protein N7477_009218 [Penicillium maclennaniae]|uniref:uncharacterized protein n=1 Tax=Penicillium maclennaniae TaxID=1343394 RepID=UPI00253FA832|nr:uncharacterized protein N7477_009218 [Penicillium maclennaniae]KAJ5661602.1 hypothetical protein N7477_009218 [Penicillium maclennaniae]